MYVYACIYVWHAQHTRLLMYTPFDPLSRRADISRVRNILAKFHQSPFCQRFVGVHGLVCGCVSECVK